MPRPSATLSFALSVFAVVSLGGCKTIYTDMYRPTRNHFKPENEKMKASDISLDTKPTGTGGADGLIPPMPQAPALDPGAAPAPAPAPGAPAPAAPPAIPGL